VTTNQVLAGVGLILVLAVGSQVLASRIRIPALIILLPAGFIAGAVTADVNPQLLLGAAFQPLVSLSVAVILYDAGLGLDLRKLHGHTRRIVTRLIVVGVPVTLAFGAVFAALLLGMSARAAVMTGAILVVSGSEKYSAPRANWRRWWAWPPHATSSAMTPGSSPRSSWG
jgi:NhaP-type Na+/H+ or K+/H+ antiporter